MSTNLLAFFRAIEALKRTPRTGWLDRGIPATEAESVADHTLLTALIAWTLALDDSLSGTASAATIFVVRALLTDAMKRDAPDADYSRHTHVDDLAQAVAELWDRPADELNGRRLDLTGA